MGNNEITIFEVGGKNSAITGGTSIVAIKSCKESKDKLSMELIKI